MPERIGWMPCGCAEMCACGRHFVVLRLLSPRLLPSVVALVVPLSEPRGPRVEKYRRRHLCPAGGNSSAKNTIDFESALRRLLAAALVAYTIEPSPRRSLQSKSG